MDMNRSGGLLGQPIRRVEDLRFISGKGAFTDDFAPENLAFGIVVRSPEANGRITALDVADAKAAPGVLAVLTAADAEADGLGLLKPSAEAPLADGSPMRVPPRTVLASDRVRHVGDPVAFVVAETLEAARDAAELVMVDIDPLPAVTTLEAVRDGTAPPAEPGWDDNILFHVEKGDRVAADAAIAGAAHVTRLDLKISRVQPTPLEPRVHLGEWDAETGRYTLHTPSQSPWRVRNTLAKEVFGVAPENVRVISPDMGGGFGNRSATVAEQALVLWAARRLGRPVKWRSDRSESFQADDQGRHSLARVELGLDGEGRFVGLRVHVLYGLGAYHAQVSVGPAVNNIGVLAGVYTIPAIHAAIDGVMLNVNPAAAYRGAGRPEASYMIERAIDQAARETGRDPVALRRANMIPPEAMPYRTALVYTYDSGDFAAVLDRALTVADYAGFTARRADAEARGKRLGLGVACSIESAGQPARGENARLKLRQNGDVEFAIGTHSHGQGHETAFRQIVGDALGLSFDDITFVQGDTDILPDGGGTAGSRSAATGGGAALLGARALVAAARPIAAEALEAAEEDIEFAAGRFTIVGTDRSLGWREVAEAAAARGVLDRLDITETYKLARNAFPNSCAIAEVEIDPDTGAVRFTRYSVVGDFGTILNPMLLDGQIHGGIAQGAGQILMEEMLWDEETGQLLTGSFMDYAMPRADDLPFFATDTLPTPTDANVIGAKGVGEAGCVASMPAVMNAIVDALAPYGITDFDMPATPHRIWRAIKSARAGR